MNLRHMRNDVFLASGVAIALVALTGTTRADECSALYKHSSVQKVISDHVERATKARQSNPDLPYDIAKNLDLLSGRVSETLRRDYVDNPRYPGELETKRGNAVDAAMGLGLNALIACFPQYKKLYVSVVEPQQNRRDLANSSPKKPETVASSGPSEDSKASVRRPSCSPVFENELAQGFATSVTNDLVRDFERMNWREPDLNGAVNEIKKKIYFKMNSLLFNDPDHARTDRIMQEINNLDIPTAKMCFPQFAAAANKISAEWASLQEEREKKKAEEVASAEREQQRIAAREKEQQDQKAREEAEAKTPRGILRHAYEDYVYLNLCQKERQGYAMVYISAPEMEDARRSVKLIEEKIVSENKDIDKVALWDQASQIKIQLGDRYRNWASMFSGSSGDTQRAACQYALHRLKVKLEEMNPSATKMKKDF